MIQSKKHLLSIIRIKEADVFDRLLAEKEKYYGEIKKKKRDYITNEIIIKADKIKHRLIQPMEEPLKSIHKLLATHFSQQILFPENIHGGIKGRSNITNAKSHYGNAFCFQLDIESFYPNVTRSKIEEALLIHKLVANRSIARIISKLTTYKNENGIDSLPQGSPASPILSNIVLLSIDYRIIKYCQKHEITYTRFVDDLTFSSKMDISIHKNFFISIVRSGFKIASDKITYRKKKFEITGVRVLTNKLDVTSKFKKKVEFLMANQNDNRNKNLNHILAYSKSIEKVNIALQKDQSIQT